MAGACRWLGPIAVGCLIWTAAVCVAFCVSGAVSSDGFAGSYNASAYWVSYEAGFVRRGLVGTVLATVLGRPPDRTAAAVLAVLLLVAVLLSLAWLVRSMIAQVAGYGRLLSAAILAASPFTFSLAVQNRGRYDAIVVVCIVAAAALGLRSRRASPLPGRLALLALATLVATATEEFALVFLAPLIVVALRRFGMPAGRVVLGSAAVLAPGVAVAVASVLVHPSLAYLTTITRRAAAAGLSVDVTAESSISALGQSAREALAYGADHSPLTIVFCAVVLGGCYLVGVRVLVLLRPVRGRAALVLTASYAVAAVVLTLIADDYRRWWGLAFTAMAASLLLLPAAGPAAPVDPSPGGRRLAAALVALALVGSAAAQLFPLWPSWDSRGASDISIDYLVEHAKR